MTEIKRLHKYGNANLINRMRHNINVENLVQPHVSAEKRGGFSYKYYLNHIQNANNRYIMLSGPNNASNNFKNLVGVALLRNVNRGRKLNAIGTVQGRGYGRNLMTRIVANAIANNKNYINLNAVPGVEDFYRKVGFVNRSGSRAGGLTLLTRWLRTNRPNNRNKPQGLGAYQKVFTARNKVSGKKAVGHRPSKRLLRLAAKQALRG